MTGLPTITAPAALDITVGSTAAINGVSLSELGAVAGENFTITLSDSNGLLSATGAGVSGAGTDTLTITGTLAQVNADLATLTEMDPIAVSDKIKILAIDSLGEFSQIDTITVTPTGTSSGITLGAPGTLLYAGVGLTTAIDGVSISAPGAPAGEIFTVELSDTYNTLAATGPGVTGSGTRTLIIFGTLAQVNADLATLKDVVSSGFRDDITVAAANASGSIAFTTIDVFGANLDISVPSGLVLGAGIASALEIGVLDMSDTAYDTLTISDVTGLLSLVGDDLVTISGNGTNHLVISGFDGNVTNAIANYLVDTEPASGIDTVSIQGVDGLGVTATSTFAVTVNGSPVLSAPTSLIFQDGSPTPLAGVSLSETGDTADAFVNVTLQDSLGEFTLSIIQSQNPETTVSGSGSNQLVIDAPLSAINMLLAEVTGLESAPGTDTIVISGSDELGGSFSKTIDVTFNTALFPTLTAPATLILDVGDTVSVPGLSLAITAPTPTERFSVTLTDTNGLLSATGPGVFGNGTDMLTISGSLAQVNQELTTVTDVDSVPGSDIILIEVNGNYDPPVSETVAVTAAEARILTISAPGVVAVKLNSSFELPITPLSISEAGAIAGEFFAATLSVSDAEIHLYPAPGNGVIQLGGTVIISGTEAQINADLADLYLYDSSAGTSAISLTVSDSLGNSAASTIAVTAASLVIAPGSVEMEQGLAAPIAVTLANIGYTQGEILTVTLSDKTGLLAAVGAGITGTGTETLVVTGTLAAVNAELATLTDTEPNPGADDITVSLNGNSPYNDSGTDNIGLSVAASPFLPSLAAPTRLYFEAGSTVAVGGKVIQASIVAGEIFTVVVSDAHDLLSATGSGVTGAGTDALTLSGSLAQVNADLAVITVSDSTFAGTDTIALHVSDGLGFSAVRSIVANDFAPAVPYLTVSGSTLTGAGTRLASLNLGTLAAGGVDDFTISISNRGIPGAAQLQGELYEIVNGSVVVNEEFNPISVGGTSDLFPIDFVGETVGLFAETFVLVPDGSSFLSVTNDRLIAEAYVTSKPTITAPSSLTLAASGTVALSGISLSEAAGAMGETYTIQLGDKGGLFFDSGAGVSGSGSDRLTITGTLAQVNADLAALLKIKETAGGSDIITLSAVDSLGERATLGSIAVAVVPPVLTLTAPSTLHFRAGASAAISGVKIVGAGGTSEIVTVELADTSGLLSATGTGVSGAGSHSLVITGTLAEVNADLATLADRQVSSGLDRITITASDSLGAAAPAVVTVTVNAPPVITVPATATVALGQSAAISGLRLAETGSAAGEIFTLKLSDAHGLLSATGPGVSGANSRALTLTGSLAQVNSDLGTFRDKDAVVGSDALTLSATDSLGGITAVSVAVTVNGPPAIAAPATVFVGQGQSTAISGVRLSESGNTTGEIFTVKLSDSTGLLAATGSGIFGSGSKNLTLSSALASVNADLAKLKDSEAGLGSDKITITATDSLANTATSSIAVTVAASKVVGGIAPAMASAIRISPELTTGTTLKMDFLAPAASGPGLILGTLDDPFTNPALQPALKSLAASGTLSMAPSVGSNLSPFNQPSNVLPLIGTLTAHGD